MRLKQIKLAGFKSFVDPTKIPFLKPLTGIIGPNGCGKSNTIDAVRWVLGESNAKHLRGDAMTDVIFNGSSARRPVSVASVELVFENLDGRLGGQYASYQEISVKRQVNRDAESSYFLNGQKCRRKDITDLFMGTGLGPRSYAIIEQGTISRLIESKPQELRVFIEEAAGISRYKERRRDTENRIRHTRENLERLGDIRLELGKQLDKLASQSKAAQRYREYKQEERQTQAQLLVMRYRELMQRADSLTDEINSNQLEQEKLLAVKASAEVNSTRERIKVEELERREQELVQAFFQAGTQVARLEQQLAHEVQKDAGLKSSLDKLANQREALVKERQILLDTIASLSSSREPLAEEAPLLEEMLAELQEQFAGMEEQKDALDGDLHNARQQQSELQLQLAKYQGQQEHSRQLLVMKREQLQELDDSGDPSAGTDKISGLQLRLDELKERKDEARFQLENLRDGLNQLNQQREQAEADSQKLRAELSGNESRQTLIRQWLDKAAGDGLPGLWQVLDVKPGWEDAVSLLLRGWLDSPVVDDNASAGAGNAWIKAGEGTVLPQLSAPVNLEPWLKDVIWLESLNEAKGRQASLAAHERVVTADGYLVGQGFVLSQSDAEDSAMALQNELQALENAAEPLVKAAGDASEESRRLKGLIDDQTNKLDAARQTLEQESHELIRVEQTLRSEQESLARQQQQLSAKKQKTDKLQQEIASLKVQVEGTEKQLEQVKVNGEGVNETVSQLTQSQLTAATALRDCKAQLGSRREQLQQLQRQLSQAETQLALSRQQESQINSRLAELDANETELKDQRRQLDPAGAGERDAVQQELQQQMARHSELQQQLEQIRAEQASWQAQLEASLLMQKQEVGKIEALSQSIADLKLKREGIKGQAGSQMQLLTEANIRLDEVTGSLPEEANAEVWQQKLDSLRGKISRLGPINLAAIEEYEQQSERKQYLDNQNDDLASALESLEEAIRKIDRETRTRFKATFEQINADLGSLFPKVFGGGSAYLALTDDDLLETGVTIMARPPGKKNSTIHLLSGGEKALTALSLVFAIFRLNPAPFCMLDEVDAPLDDANVERFCRLLREMSQSVQFIYISHNKITMEMADQLIGVTMHEPGVSRIVAVDLEEAVAMADAG